MAHGERTTSIRGFGGRVTFPRLIAVTTGLVGLTVLLGVATKATGAGLACQARWPVCDGGFLNLFPRSFPSFFEWIHRVVAGVAGLAILGTAWVAWRGDASGRVRMAVALGTALLPVQVLLGRETVLSYTVPVLAAHFWVAVTIFASFSAATIATWRTALSPGRLRIVAAAGAVLVPAQVLLYPPLVTSFTPPVQTLQYAVTLAALTVALATGIAGRAYLDGRLAAVAAALPVLHPMVVFAGRHLLDPTAPLLAAYGLLAAMLVAGFLLTATALDRGP